MIVPKEMITFVRVHFGLPFLDDFPTDVEYQTLLNAAKYYDAIDNTSYNVEIISELETNAGLWLQIEGTKMKEMYHVFNPINGQYTVCNSVDEAKQVREQVMQEYLKFNWQLFSVAQAVETEKGDTLWQSIDLDKV